MRRVDVLATDDAEDFEEEEVSGRVDEDEADAEADPETRYFDDLDSAKAMPRDNVTFFAASLFSKKVLSDCRKHFDLGSIVSRSGKALLIIFDPFSTRADGSETISSHVWGFSISRQQHRLAIWRPWVPKLL